MGAARHTTDLALQRADRVLQGGSRRLDPSESHGAASRRPSGGTALLALQRRAGNAAVSALLTGKGKAQGPPAERIEAGLAQLRSDDPVLDVVEAALKEARAVGVTVDLDGTPPPAAALEVKLTGFGPAAVTPAKPPPPPKAVPKVPALGAVARGPAVGKGAPGGKGKAGATALAPKGKGGVAGPSGPAAGAPAALGPDRMRQPPVPPPGLLPAQDPAFTAVTGGISGAAGAASAHGPAAAKAEEAQQAAQPPAGDLAAQAEAAKVDQMDAQQPGAFDKVAFIAAVKAAIEAKAPTTLEQADDYAKSGKAGQVRGEVTSLVTQGKSAQTQDIAAATQAPPDQSTAVAKEVVPLASEPVGQIPPVPAEGAAPRPAPPEQTNLQAGKQQVEDELAGADVTEEQLGRSREPEFEPAVVDKRDAAAHADTAPDGFRAHEQQVIEQDRAGARAGVTQAVVGMQGTRAGAIAGLVGDKAATKEEDEGKRGEVAAKVGAIYGATEQDVKAILDGVDPKVEKAFGEGEASARAAFESFVDAKMSAYKCDRYGGMLGGLRWAKDKLVGMPAKVNDFYRAGRELYLQRMDKVISGVADIVGGDLTRAKKRISAGRAEIAAYVKSLPADLRKTGAKAAQEIGDRFASLEREVAAKQEAAVDMLATRYTESRKALDGRIEELQAANQGLVDKALGAIKGVIDTIRGLAAMLENVLARVSGVVGKIIKDPIGFLGNLVSGVKGGILRFRDNILDHLRKGLMGWLFGALAEGGIELPESFDLKGIVRMLASLFGLTWRTIRDRILRRVGARAMGAIEQGVVIFQVLATQGLGGLWEMLLDKLGNIKDMILEQVQDFVITKIITAGITWLIGLLNPAAAFIKACKMIYDVVMFFVTNAARIARFVDTVIDSVSDIVRGNVSGVAEKINDVLGQMVPIIIGFLASAIGLGGIGKKIREIITTLQKPFMKAVNYVIDKGLKLAGPLLRGAKRLGGRVKAAVRGGDDSPAGKQRRLDAGMRVGVGAVNRFAGRPVGERVLRPVLGALRMRYGLEVLEPFRHGNRWAIRGQVQRMTLLTQAEAEDLSKASRLEPAEVAYFRGRLEDLPERSSNRNYPQPRAQARTAVSNLHRGVRDLDGNVRTLKALFALFGAARHRHVPEAPVGGQQLKVRIRVKVPSGTTPLEMSADKPRGTGDLAPRGNGYELFNRSTTIVGGKPGGRGAVYTRHKVPNASNETDVLARTWASGGTPAHAANTSHTENQFSEWLAHQGPDFAKRVVAIELHSTYSPCSTCVDCLLGIRSMLDDNRDGNPSPTLMISWKRWYAPHLGGGAQHRVATQTRIGNVITLERSRWRTSGPRE